MRPPPWQLVFGAALVLLSAGLYALHFAIFQDAKHIWIYLLGDLAFLPVEVLLVTMILHQLLIRREKQAMLGKLNMVIGVFFNETGTELLRRAMAFSPVAAELRQTLRPQGDWTAARFQAALARAVATPPQFDCRRGDLAELRAFLVAQRPALLRLLENPNLLEHEAFTDVLWAVAHLAEELSARDLARPLSEPDARHLAGDLQRAYERTLAAWVEYLRHLQGGYPYLYSLAVRQNPFDPEADPTVR